MKTTFNKAQRRYVDQWPLTGTPLSTGAPTLKLSVSHYKERKYYVAVLAYVELEQNPGYAVELWQSDWPLLQVDILPAARYSEKALTEFRQQVLQRLTDGDFTDPRVLGLLSRVTELEVAA